MNILIVGVTGLVGQCLLSLLDKSNIDINTITFVASSNSKNKNILFRNKTYLIKTFDEVNLKNIDIACLLTSSEVSKLYTPILLKNNIIVIDNSSAFREQYQLTIPEINFIKNKDIYINPNCCIIQSIIPLHYIKKEININKIIYNTYQSCSGGGNKLVTKLNNNEIKSCLPFIGEYCNDNTTEEEKLIYETKKLLSNDITVFANCVRVPTFSGHLVNIILEVDNCCFDTIYKILNTNTIYDNNCCYIDMTNNYNIYTCRLKQLNTNTFSFYTYSNNLLRGSSYNTFKILESILK